MASDAILLNHFLGGLLHLDHLRLFSQGDHRGMLKPVFGLKVIFAHHVVVWNMATVASCSFPVRAMHPAVVFRGHDMTVHTSLGVVPHVGNDFGFFGKEE